MNEAVEPAAGGRFLALVRGTARALLRIPRGRAALPVALWMALIWLLSAVQVVPGMGAATGATFVANLAHAFVFGVLALLLVLLLPRRGGWARLSPRALGWVAVFAIAYGLLDEAHQSTIPGRDASLLDLVTDAVGVFCVLKIVAYVSDPEATSRGLWSRFRYALLLCVFAAGSATLYSVLHGEGPWF